MTGERDYKGERACGLGLGGQVPIRNTQPRIGWEIEAASKNVQQLE
jgi:hypothetical protein